MVVMQYHRNAVAMPSSCIAIYRNIHSAEMPRGCFFGFLEQFFPWVKSFFEILTFLGEHESFGHLYRAVLGYIVVVRKQGYIGNQIS